ncbi:MAG: sulfite exporter TauE/SafE family protein [Shewanella sp.]|uniref:sulfite exporter TauE/SafE family protein n=1 Tax=Shewanella sp. SNU WT4 TaxID=2590015 RepID=UPI0011281F99|nr:sulfite exporter TauE/SafE family protein [Shewanella sp. SNU WT4]QDF66301.1 sulfite exporter TauE/SafE family protein [Shewanella sp. SNU WT4]
MDTIVWLMVWCLILGSFVGFLAGLLGIGGGLIIVPALLYLLPKVGISEPHLLYVAIATSLSAIILTSASSAKAHWGRGNVDFTVLKALLPGIVIGAFLSGFIAKAFLGAYLQQVFAIFVMLMAINMWFPLKVNAAAGLPSNSVIFVIGIIIAMISGLMGIGGGVLLVPFLVWCGLAMAKAVGTSSMIGIVIACFGSLGYITTGWDVHSLPAGTLGYIYVPALLAIVSTSVLTAPLGAKAASIWPTPILKRIFALLLIVIGVKLLLS